MDVSRGYVPTVTLPSFRRVPVFIVIHTCTVKDYIIK